MKPLHDYRHIFFLGIGGIGMSAIARMCRMWGIEVSGYDRLSSSITSELEAEGAEIIFKDDPTALERMPELVIYTPAISPDSRLMQFFNDQAVPIVKRAEALGKISENLETIAVAGTHGKTTTSSMISFLLSACDRKHTALLGGIAVNYQSNFISQGMDLLVTEADEYDRSFHRLFPKWTVVTAMDPDHLDIYGTPEAMVEAYRKFIGQTRENGVLLYHESLRSQIGEELLSQLEARHIGCFSYGLNAGDFKAEALTVENGVWRFNLKGPGIEVEDLALMMPGRHNVTNAIAACVIVLLNGVDGMALQMALPEYKGVSRRFEIRYRDEEHVFIDDYAHHPEELEAAITAARETFGDPVTGVFQPHLYSRTKDLAEGFAAALDQLDYPVIIDIYPAREVPIPGVSSQTIYDLMKNPNKKYCPGDSWIEWIIEKKPRVLITLGAGDLDKHIPALIRRLYDK